MKEGYLIDRVVGIVSCGDTLEKSYISVHGYCTGDKIYEFIAEMKLDIEEYGNPDNGWMVDSIELS